MSDTPRPPERLRSPAHGFGDDAEARRLLRSRPPTAALRWTERCLGGSIISVRPLRGGTSSAVHLLQVRDAAGHRHDAVLRRYVRPELNDEEPDLVEREARALGVVGRIEVATPCVLAVDPTGTEVGVPTLLMTRVQGRVDWWPRDMARWLQRLADVLPTIHGASLPPLGVIRPFVPYSPVSDAPPTWARHRGVWARAVAIALAPPPDLPSVLIQRDFHPGNVLWRRGRVTGVVDWQAASIGPSVADVAHCRTNLLAFSAGTAERFTRYWEAATGIAFHPWADVVTIVGLLDDLRTGWGSERLAVETLLAQAVAELGGGS